MRRSKGRQQQGLPTLPDLRLSHMPFSLDESEDGDIWIPDQDDLDWALCLEECLVSKKRTKQFRFATDIQVVHEIEKIDDPSLWWNSDDDELMRERAMDTAQVYRRQKPEFTEAVLLLSKARGEDEGQRSMAQKLIKVMTDDSVGRGLEKLIVPSLMKMVNATVESVLTEQARCRRKGLEYSISCERLRKKSLENSNAVFARYVAESDQSYVNGDGSRQCRRRAMLERKQSGSRRMERRRNMIEF